MVSEISNPFEKKHNEIKILENMILNRDEETIDLKIQVVIQKCFEIFCF